MAGAQKLRLHEVILQNSYKNIVYLRNTYIKVKDRNVYCITIYIHYVIRNSCPSPQIQTWLPCWPAQTAAARNASVIEALHLTIFVSSTSDTSLYTISITVATAYKTLYDTRRVLYIAKPHSWSVAQGWRYSERKIFLRARRNNLYQHRFRPVLKRTEDMK